MHKVSEDACGQNCGERPGAALFAGHEPVEMQAYLLYVEMEHVVRVSAWVQSLLQQNQKCQLCAQMLPDGRRGRKRRKKEKKKK